MEILSLARLFHAREGTLASWLTEESVWSRREIERLRRSVGEEAAEAGAWTQFLQPAVSASPQASGADVAQAGGAALNELLEPLAEGASRSREQMVFAFRVLGRIHSPAALDLIGRMAAQHQAVIPAMGAFSTLGTAQAAERAVALCRAVEVHSTFPSLLEGFARLPSPVSFQYLSSLAPRGGEIASGVVAALEGFEAFDHLPILESAMRSGDPWVLIEGAETLGRIGTPEHLKRIEVVFDSSSHPLIQIACLQAVSADAGPGVLRIASKGLASANPAVQAAAIEALISAQIPYAQFRDRVVALLGSQHPKLSLNALLACIAVDPQRAVQRTTELLRSGVPTELVQAIQALAYIEAPSSTEALARAVSQCPPGPLRVQAIRSLGRLVSRMPDAIEALGKLLDDEDPKTREGAAWFLAGTHPASRKRAAEVLAKRCRNEENTPASIAMVEALGFLGKAANLAVPDLHYLLLVGPLQAETAARALATSFPRAREAQDLATHGSPAVEAYAGLLQWYEEGGGVERIVEALRSEDTFTFRAGCEVARLAALAATVTGETRRLTGLAAKLGGGDGDGADLSGLGQLDRSISIPRRKIGLGLVPRPDSRTASFAPVSLEVASPRLSDRPEDADQEAEDAVMDTSYYPGAKGQGKNPIDEIIKNAQAQGQAEGAPPDPEPARESRGPPTAIRGPRGQPSREDARESLKDPAKGTQLPARTADQSPSIRSRVSVVVFWVGISALCVATLFLGRWLRSLLG